MTYQEHLLYKKIEQLESELTIKQEALSAYRTVCQNQRAQIVRLLEQLNPEHPVFGHKHDSWFDQTVSI